MGAGLVHFFLQTVVLILALILFRVSIGWEYLPLLLPALASLLLLGAGLGLFLSAVNELRVHDAHDRARRRSCGSG